MIFFLLPLKMAEKTIKDYLDFVDGREAADGKLLETDIDRDSDIGDDDYRGHYDYRLHRLATAHKHTCHHIEFADNPDWHMTIIERGDEEMDIILDSGSATLGLSGEETDIYLTLKNFYVVDTTSTPIPFLAGESTPATLTFQTTSDKGSIIPRIVLHFSNYAVTSVNVRIRAYFPHGTFTIKPIRETGRAERLD